MESCYAGVHVTDEEAGWPRSLHQLTRVDSPHKDQAEWGLVEISLYFNLSSFATDYHHPTSLAISILCWSPCRTKLKTTFVKVVTTLPEVVKPVYVYPAPDCDFQTAQYLFTNVT